MGVLIPNGVRRNPVSTAVWLASKRRNEKRNYYLNGTTPPFGSLAFYDYAQENLSNAVKELVNKQLTLYTGRASNANIIQSSNGSVLTYAENEPAFDIGNSLVVEGEATTQQPTDITLWSDSGNIDVTYDSGSLVNTLVANAVVSNHRIFSNTAIVAGAAYTSSLLIKKGGYRYVQFTGSTGFAVADVINFDLQAMTVNVTGGTPTGYIEDVGEYVRVVSTSFADSNQASGRVIFAYAEDLNSGRLPALDIDGETLEIKYYNFVQSAFTSSPINAPTMPATRAASNAQIATLREVGAWQAEGVVFGEFNNVDFVNGYSRTQGRALFFANNEGAVGTFDGLLAADMVGGEIRSNGSILRVDSLATAVQLGVTLVKGSHSDFEGLQPLVFDFIPSDYDTGDFAADTTTLETLLGDAGYVDIPAAVQWPLTDFVFEIDFILRGFEAGTNARIFERANSGSDRFLLTMTDDRIRLLIAGTGVSLGTDATVLFTPAIGTRYSIRVTVDSANNNNTLEVAGVGTDTDTACTGVVSTTLPLTANVAESPYATLPLNADVKAITLSPL